MIITKNGSLMPSVLVGSAGAARHKRTEKVDVKAGTGTRCALCPPAQLRGAPPCAAVLPVMYTLATLSPQISRTLDWMSWSVMRLMCPFLTCDQAGHPQGLPFTSRL